MKKFLVVVHGNYPSADPPRGFYTGRFIKAHSIEDAQERALQLVASDPNTDTGAGEAPMLEIENCTEIGLVRWLQKHGDGGYIYYGDGIS